MPNAGGEDDPHTPCCDQRHACIQTCGVVKTFCDEEFLKCSKDVCDKMSDAEAKKKCDSSVSVNELMLKMDQCQQYNAEQGAHCQCIKKSDVASKRERVLRNFYKKFNPDSVDKVPGLMKKVDSARKMAGLLTKLYKKYPSVIKKVKDPQQEMMEKIMRDAKDKKSDEGEEVDEDDEESDTEDLGVDEL